MINDIAIGLIEFFSGNYQAIFALAGVLAVAFFYIEWKFDI
jgi:hypothetical protein